MPQNSTRFGHGGFFKDHFYRKLSTECAGERILEIDHYLAKIETELIVTTKMLVSQPIVLKKVRLRGVGVTFRRNPTTGWATCNFRLYLYKILTIFKIISLAHLMKDLQ